MFLALDIGNSRIKAGLFESGRLVDTFTMSNDQSASVAAYRHSLRGHVGDRTPIAAAVSSVVPEMTERIVAAVRDDFMILPVVISHDLVTAFEIDYDPAESLGVDRLCAVAAASEKYGLDQEGNLRPLIVIDAGTAATIDLLVDGVFRGGAIMPGPRLMVRALAAGAARLTEVDLGIPKNPVGNSTLKGLESGIMLGFLDAVTGMIDRFIQAEARKPFVVATGGGGKLLADELAIVDYFDGDLVLEGIFLLATSQPL